MELDVRRVPLEAILSLRELYRQEMACQIVHDSYHGRGVTDSYLLSVDGEIAGYGSTKAADGKVRDCVKEFYVLPDRRFLADRLFQSLLNATNSIRVESQTNDRLLTLMLFDHCRDVGSDTVLFEDGFTATHSPAGVIYREGTPADKHRIFDHTVEPVGDWLLEFGGEIVATGGILCHYNPPYGDIFMEVAPSHRRRGFGRFLVQELKRTCYAMGKVPAARCDSSNRASRRTLQAAGMLPCARLLRGIVAG